MPWQGVEFLTFRLRATIPKAAFELTRIAAGSQDAGTALKRTRHAWFDETQMDVPVFDGELLRAGNRFSGPALIEETTTTVVVPPRYELTVDPWKNYVLRRDTAAKTQGKLAAAFVTGGA